MAALRASVATLALLTTLAVDAIVFPSAQPLAMSNGTPNCPFPLPEGVKMSTLDRSCYQVTDVEDQETYVLLTGTETQCRQNHVRHADGRCLQVVLRQQQPPKKKKPQGTPTWQTGGR